MQPYFFPYLGYYGLIANTDRFIFLDEVQFIRHGWIERNRIISIKNEPMFIKVPLKKHPRSTSIRNISIRNEESWRSTIFAQLTHYKRKAPFYGETLSVLDQCFALNTDSIAELNAHVLEVTCNYLNIPFSYSIFSKMDLEIEAPRSPDEWALNISKVLRASMYINPPGGVSFFDRSKFERVGIEIKFLEPRLEPYQQFGGSEFLAGLSIIDVMMFNSPDKINRMLKKFELF